MRVISGTLKGRIIKGDHIEGTRPTMDKIKESLFAIIQNEIKDSICLDLFAGSGSLGIEAISNGAKYAYFVDSNRKAIEVIKDNLKTFKIEEFTKIINVDYKKALKYFYDNNITFDLIFLDPPYQDNLINESINLILEYNLLKEKGLIICEYMKEELGEFQSLKVIKEKKYGDKYIKIYIK